MGCGVVQPSQRPPPQQPLPLMLMLLFSLAPSAPAPVSVGSYSAPLYNITANSLYDAGRQQGVLAQARIGAWFATSEMQRVLVFAQSGGKDAYWQLRNASTGAYPQYADELRGISDGSGVALHKIWAGILMIELLNLMLQQGQASGQEASDHCSDISAVAADGHTRRISHGHNEDWSPAAGALYYYVKLTPAGPEAGFEGCAGLAYPGALVGWAPTWNRHGLFFSVNTLVPRSITTTGVGTAFVQREAICGLGQGENITAVVRALASSKWADGASVNVVDTRGRQMGNMETWEEQHSYLGVSGGTGNASHFNAYKHLKPAPDGGPDHSSVVRQRRADALPAPRSRSDVARILSNTADGASDSILRNITIATLLLDETGRLEAWAGAPSASSPPLHSWNLSGFWR